MHNPVNHSIDPGRLFGLIMPTADVSLRTKLVGAFS
jgi:hypothetical protein